MTSFYDLKAGLSGAKSFRFCGRPHRKRRLRMVSAPLFHSILMVLVTSRFCIAGLQALDIRRLLRMSFICFQHCIESGQFRLCNLIPGTRGVE